MNYMVSIKKMRPCAPLSAGIEGFAADEPAPRSTAGSSACAVFDDFFFGGTALSVAAQRSSKNLP